MPKKTRREKMLARERRSNPYTFSAHLSSQAPSPITNVNTEEYSQIRKDLIKTVVLAAMAVGVELVLYWRLSA